MPKAKLGPKSFYEDLRKFRAKYPMVYIEAWTPEDYEAISTWHPENEHGASETVYDSPEIFWDDQKHLDISEILYDEFDASIGTSWDRVQEACDRVKSETD